MYSIWLTFEPVIQARLRETISQLADSFVSPKFEPHVTLVGEIDLPKGEIATLCARYTSRLSAQQVTVNCVGKNGGYFMALFLKVDLPAALIEARKHLATALGPEPLGLDPAHISLAYGNRNLPDNIDTNSPLHAAYVGTQLLAKQIEIVESSRSKPIDQWRSVQSFELAS